MFLVANLIYLANNVQTTICIAVVNYLCIESSSNSSNSFLQGILSNTDLVLRFADSRFTGENSLLPTYISQLILVIEFILLFIAIY